MCNFVFNKDRTIFDKENNIVGKIVFHIEAISRYVIYVGKPGNQKAAAYSDSYAKAKSKAIELLSK